MVAVALAASVEMGFKVLACPSTGNLANAVAAAAARAGIRSVVLVPADLEQQKILGTAIYGGTMATVDGTYDDVNRLASELADDREDWAFVNVNVRPYYCLLYTSSSRGTHRPTAGRETRRGRRRARPPGLRGRLRRGASGSNPVAPTGCARSGRS